MRVVWLLLLSFLFFAPARAGDLASVRPLGFSPDGAYFAFSQWGVQDGSGFAYADVFVIDLKRDAWAGGSPARVVLREESASPARALRAAMRKAAPLLRKLGVGGRMALLAHNPLTELSADSRHVAFSLSAANPLSRFSFDLTMKTYPVPMPECARGAAEPLGFSLGLTAYDGGRRWRLHRDAPGRRLPKSRGCALDYRITHVISFSGARPEGAVPGVVLVAVFSRGFEGSERGRFIAIPFHVDGR